LPPSSRPASTPRPTPPLTPTCPSAAAAPACDRTVSGYSGFFGAAAKKPTDRYHNQVPRWEASGDIRKVQLFYSYNWGCIFGVRTTYGSESVLMGMETNLASSNLTLAPGEYITQAQYKGGVK
jgi:hypothetical protein